MSINDRFYISQKETYFSIEKELLAAKGIFFVAALFFGGGAAASLFVGFGISGLVSFSLASFGCLISICVIIGGRKYILFSTNEIKKEVEVKKEVNEKFVLALNVERMVSLGLKQKISILFKEHIKEGEAAVAKALQPLFTEIKADPERFKALTKYIIEKIDYPPMVLAAVLEKLEWPDEEMKKQCLIEDLGKLIARNFILCKKTSFKNSTNDAECTLRIDAKKLIGTRDVTTDPSQLTAYFAEVIGFAIQTYAEDEVKQHLKGQNIIANRNDYNIKIYLQIGQFQDSYLPEAMLTSLSLCLNKEGSKTSGKIYVKSVETVVKVLSNSVARDLMRARKINLKKMT